MSKTKPKSKPFTNKNLAHPYITWVHSLGEDNQWFPTINEVLKGVTNNCSRELQKLDPLSNYKKLTVVGITPINRCLQQFTYGHRNISYLMYILVNNNRTQLYVAIGLSHPLLWYKFTNKDCFEEQLPKLIKVYNPEDYPTIFDRHSIGYVGDEQSLETAYSTIQNYMLAHPSSELLIWGDRWRFHPFQKVYSLRDVTPSEHIVFSTRAMEQSNIYNTSVRTLFSKSIVSIGGDGYILCNNYYDEIQCPQTEKINQLLKKDYPTNMPVDVLDLILNLPYFSVRSILDVELLSQDVLNIGLGLIKSSDDCQIQIDKLENRDDSSDYEDHIKFLKMKKLLDEKLLLSLIEAGKEGTIIPQILEKHPELEEFKDVLEKYVSKIIEIKMG